MTNRRSHLILVGLILAALAGVVALAIPGSPIHKKVTLGLDLQGGLEVVLKAQPAKGQKLDSAALDRSVSIMRQRVDKLGVSEPEIRKQGSNQIVIELAGVHDPAKAANIIGKTAQLELYDLETSLTGPSITASGNPQPSTSLAQLLKAVQSQAKKGEPEGFYAFGKNKDKSVGTATTRAEALKQAGTRQDFDPTTSEPVVLMQFTGSGSHKFQAVTAEEYNRGRNRQIPQHFAIVLDREIRSFPQIDFTKSDLAGGISGNAEISGR